MKPVNVLDPNYLPIGALDANNGKVALVLNLIGLVLLFIFGWIFTKTAGAIRPEINEASLLLLLRDLGVLALILVVAGVLILHELIHGIFFWLFTHERPKFGIHLYYAYAAAPGWYLPRNRFIVVGLAPLITITVSGLFLLPYVPDAAVSFLSVFSHLQCRRFRGRSDRRRLDRRPACIAHDP